LVPFNLVLPDGQFPGWQAAKVWFSRISQNSKKEHIAKQASWKLRGSLVAVVQAAESWSYHHATKTH